LTTENAHGLELDKRSGLPEELHVLLKEHPRDSWQSSRSPMAEFWVQKHAYLKRQSDALMAANDQYREERVDAVQFGSAIAPRLQAFLGELHGHHQIEDFHYFPAFRRAEPRLNAGFDVLGRDHEQIHAGIMNIVETINAFITTIRDESTADRDAQRHAADKYIEASELMDRRLARHLADEEDLIIPVMLKEGH
jgi:hemerythrin-like domain-containing protein